MKTASLRDSMSPLCIPEDSAASNEVYAERLIEVGSASRGPLSIPSPASEYETELSAVYPCKIARIEDRVLTVEVKAPLLWEEQLVEKYTAACRRIPGLQGIRVHILASGIHGLG